MRAQRAQVMRDEVLRTPRDPREVTDTELVRLGQRSREREPSRVTQRPRPVCSSGRLNVTITGACPDHLGHFEVEAEQIALVGAHCVILTTVDVLVRASRPVPAAAAGDSYASDPGGLSSWRNTCIGWTLAGSGVGRARRSCIR